MEITTITSAFQNMRRMIYWVIVATSQTGQTVGTTVSSAKVWAPARSMLRRPGLCATAEKTRGVFSALMHQA